MPNASFYSRTLQALFFGVFALVAIVLYAARVVDPGPNSGEYWSDSNIINACRGYDDVGFGATWGLPRVQTAAPLGGAESVYITYPPGPYWFSYVGWSVGKALGLEPILSARVFAQTCGLVSAWLAFVLFSRLTRSRGLGALGGLLYMVSVPFLSYSAALHHMAYSPMLLLGAMLAWLAFERGRGARRVVWLGVSALLFFADCWTNFEHMFFFAMFVGVRTVFHFRVPVILGAALVGPIPIPVMFLRVLHNAQLLGGWDESMRVFLGKASLRSGGGRRGLDYSELLSYWLARLGWPWFDRASDSRLDWNRLFVYPALSPWVLGAVVAGLVLLAWWWWRRPREGRADGVPRLSGAALSDDDLGRVGGPQEPRVLWWRVPGALRSPGWLGLANGLLLLAGGLTWFVVMTQHTRPHRFIILLLMPGLALLLGTLAWSVLAAASRTVRETGGRLGWWVRLRAWGVVAVLLLAFAWEARRADVLNQLVRLDADIHEMVRSRAEATDRAAAVGRALEAEGVRRVILYDGTNIVPWRAVAIDLPFRFSRHALPSILDSGDALYVEAHDARERGACLTAVERLGLPDFPVGTGARTYVFHPPEAWRTPDTAVDLELAPGLVLRSMRSQRTPDGEQVIVALWVTGNVDPDAPPLPEILIYRPGYYGPNTSRSNLDPASFTRLGSGAAGVLNEAGGPEGMEGSELPEGSEEPEGSQESEGLDGIEGPGESAGSEGSEGLEELELGEESETESSGLAEDVQDAEVPAATGISEGDSSGGAGLEDMSGRISFTLRARDGAGQLLGEETTRIAWTPIRDRNRALLVIALRAEQAPPGCTLELSLWEQRERRRISPPEVLPPGFTTDPRGRVLRWVMP